MTLTNLAQGTSLEELYATTFHELRAPLSSINGYTSVLLTGELGKLNPRQKESLERIQELCRSLTNLIGNLLTLAKSGARRFQSVRQFIDLAALSREVARSLQGEVGRKKLRLRLKLPRSPLRFWADPTDLDQILLNLLSNAVKFTPSKGQVSLAMKLKAREVLIEVADTGVGISPEELPKIFQEFYHVDRPEAGASPGSGLGLAIVKRLVEAYEGQITVSSRVGAGTSFVVTLPVRPEGKILIEFLEEVWSQARQGGQSMGLILLQIKPSKGFSKDLVQSLEQGVRDHLRKEDRLFHLPGKSILAVLVEVEPKGFSMLVHRLEQALRENSLRFKHRRAPSGKFPWRVVAMLAPQRGGSPNRFLDLAQTRLQRAWG